MNKYAPTNQKVSASNLSLKLNLNPPVKLQQKDMGTMSKFSKAHKLLSTDEKNNSTNISQKE